MSRVDVVIPCYKYAHYLRGCAESVLGQQGVDVRVLIIDDCSPDNTPEVAAQLVAENPARVEYRRHAVNHGHIATYNEGLLGWASADYCLLLSADDMLTPGALRRAMAVMDANPAVAVAYGRAIQTEAPERHVVASVDQFAHRVMKGVEFLQLSCETAENQVPTPTAVVRTRIQKTVGGYRQDLPHAGDMEMWLRLALHGDVAILDADQAFYRVHSQNMSRSYPGLKDLQQRLLVFNSVFDQAGDRVEGASVLKAMALKRVAEGMVWSSALAWDAGDQETARGCLAAATATCPGIVRWRPYWTQRVKHAIGPRLTSWLRARRRDLLVVTA